MAAHVSAIQKKRGGANFFTLVLLLAPALILFTIFVSIPIVQAAIFSLYKWNGLGPMTKLVGIQNFITLAQDVVFQNALLHNVLVVVFSLTIQLPMALGLAVIISRSDFKLAVLFRTFFFLPYVLSEVITGVLWQFIYHPQYGLVRSITQMIAPGSPTVALLGTPGTVLWAILGVIIWKYFGLHMMIYIAGLQDVPVEQQEAAQIDGATGWQVFRHVTLPFMKTPIIISVFFSIVGAFQVFDVVWAMGKGDPVNAAETMVTYLYKFGFQRFNIGYGGSVAVTIFIICLIFSVIYRNVLVHEDK